MTTERSEPGAAAAGPAGRSGDAADELRALWERTQAEVAQAFQCVDWGEDEIARAQARHPDAADLLWHSWDIIQPPEVFPLTEFVWRGHMRELLERIAAGQDTRPATYAEICIVCREASALAPLTTSAAGLYMRAWLKAFPDNPIPFPGELGSQAGMRAHYEAIRGSGIDDLEREVRAKIARRNPNRRLPKDLECDGRHNGREVACRFAAALFPASSINPATARDRRPARNSAGTPPRRSPGPGQPELPAASLPRLIPAPSASRPAGFLNVRSTSP